MRTKILLCAICLFPLLFGVSCRTQTNAQRATKIAKKRYKHIKHDCNCHSYLYQPEDNSEIEG